MTVKKNSESEIISSIWLNEIKTEVKKVIQLGKDEERISLYMEEGNEDIAKTGYPALPYLEYRILLPKGSVVKNIDTVSQNTERKILPLKIAFIPAPITRDDYADPQKRALWENSLHEDSGIYSTDVFYPKENITYEQKIYRGYRVLHLKAVPFRYNPVKNELLYSRHIVCKISLEKETESSRIPDIYIRSKESDIEFIEKLVVNKEEITSYQRK